MRNKNFFFIVFEGIEGSGKSYHSKKLFNNIKKKKFPVILTREPGGSIGAERIRELILKDYFHKNKNLSKKLIKCVVCINGLGLFILGDNLC